MLTVFRESIEIQTVLIVRIAINTVFMVRVEVPNNLVRIKIQTVYIESIEIQTVFRLRIIFFTVKLNFRKVFRQHILFGLLPL